MESFLIIFEFESIGQHGEQYTLDEALENHPQIKKYLKREKAIQLTPAAFLMKSEESVEQIYGKIAAFIDRHEAVFIFNAIFTDWTAYGGIKILNKVSKVLDLDLSKFG